MEKPRVVERREVVSLDAFTEFTEALEQVPGVEPRGSPERYLGSDEWK